jgi:hypothetical protein
MDMVIINPQNYKTERPRITVVFSLKGWNNIAQGNALGKRTSTTSSLKGWDKESFPQQIVPALQAGIPKNQSNPGRCPGLCYPSPSG